MSEIVFEDTEQYREEGLLGSYIFPFTVLDATPGGGNLGSIEWHVELHPAKKQRGENRKRLGEVWIWASQTRDTRYVGKVFKFTTNAEALCQSSLKRNFVPWRIQFCDEHRGALVISAYPENQHTRLRVRASSSISFDVGFE